MRASRGAALIAPLRVPYNERRFHGPDPARVPPALGGAHAGRGTAEERIRLFRFIRDLTASEYADWWDVEIIHGSGSPAAEWLQISREYDLAGAAAHVERLVRGA